jgi:hypothetical protein
VPSGELRFGEEERGEFLKEHRESETGTENGETRSPLHSPIPRPSREFGNLIQSLADGQFGNLEAVRGPQDRQDHHNTIQFVSHNVGLCCV